MLAIAGGKGGCGKTTTTLGLARAHPDRVLAADLDWDMPNLHAVAGLDRRTSLGDGSWGPAWSGRRRSREFGCDVLPAPPVDAADRPAPLSGVTRLSGARLPVLLDCPCGAGPDAVKPLSLADGTVVVTTVCRASLRGALKTAEASRAVGTPVVGVVATRTPTAGTRLESLFDAPVLSTVPDADGPPLSAPGVREAYERAIERLEPAGSNKS